MHVEFLCEILWYVEIYGRLRREQVHIKTGVSK